MVRFFKLPRLLTCSTALGLQLKVELQQQEQAREQVEAARVEAEDRLKQLEQQEHAQERAEAEERLERELAPPPMLCSDCMDAVPLWDDGAPVCAQCHDCYI